MKRLFTFLCTGLLLPAMVFAQRPPAPDDVLSVQEGAFITQINNNNEASIEQIGDPAHQGEIYQNGDRNDAMLKQDGTTNSGLISQVGDDNTGYITTIGIGHIAVIVQEGNNHNTQFTINGEFNTVDIRQFGTSEHTVGYEGDVISSVQQNGNFNRFFSVQIGEDGGHLITTADGSDYIQSGDDNTIDAWQQGDNQTAKFNQFGNRNTILLDQFGAGNMANVIQNGNGQSATVYQDGSGNTATINQSQTTQLLPLLNQ